MYDDAEWLRFGIDQQLRAALQAFVTVLCKRVSDRDLREDAEMEAYYGILAHCLEHESRDEQTLKGVARQAVADFFRTENAYSHYFPISLEALPE